jgi:hypothetical protein
MQIKDIRPGDNLILKRADNDKLVLILILIIKLFYPKWDMWGWHMAVVIWPEGEGWIVLEATWPKVRLNHLFKMGEYRAYRWFEVQPDHDKILRFMQEMLGKRYDMLLYLWTAVQYIVRYFWNRPIPRLLDDRFTC